MNTIGGIPPGSHLWSHMWYRVSMSESEISAESRALGCLVGLACGDYLGLPMEGERQEKVETENVQPRSFIYHHEKYPAGYYSDDTSMAICLAESLTEKGFDVKDQLSRYKKWLKSGYDTPLGDKAFGVGKRTARSLTYYMPDTIPHEPRFTKEETGNGALMRCAPVGIKYRRQKEKLIEYSIESAIVTHNNLYAAWSCVVANLFIAYAFEGVDKEDLVGKVLAEDLELPEGIKEILGEDLHTKKKSLSNYGHSLDTLRIAVRCFLENDSFETTVKAAIDYGGDTDTQGAVTGSLAGAYYGYRAIPQDWKHKLINRSKIEKLAEKLVGK